MEILNNYTYTISLLLLLCVCLPSCTVTASNSRGKSQEDTFTCPGSPAWKHASCKMIIKFQNTPCSTVQSEISLRLTSPSWIDPHNQGVYTQLEQSSDSKGGSLIKGQRLTGNQKYTDLFAFSLKPDSDGSGCHVSACSESQVFSILDFSTNYCNLRNLYCNSADGCVPVQYDLAYEEEYTQCGQNKKADCIVLVDES